MNKDMILTDRQNTRLRRFFFKNKVVLRNSPYIVKSRKNKVNLNAWIVPEGKHNNVGDYLSVVVTENVCNLSGIDIDKTIEKTRQDTYMR